MIAGGGHRADARHRPAPTRSTARPSSSYSEVTGITQTARNFGASLGLAVLGAILVSQNKTNVTDALTKHGVPRGRSLTGRRLVRRPAAPRASRQSGQSHALVHDVQLAFAHSTQTVFYIMAGVMVATFIVAVRGLPRGRVETTEEDEVTPSAVTTSGV